MNKFQEAVQEFHEATGGWGNVDTPEGRELRAKLIMEEAVETVAALGFGVDAQIAPANDWSQKPFTFSKSYDEPNLLDFIDGICDSIYVLMGGAMNIPVNIEHHFEEVHAANMRKLNGPMREDGKVLKPEGWVGPDHQKVLDTYKTLTPTAPRKFVDTYHGSESEAENRHERLLWGGCPNG